MPTGLRKSQVVSGRKHTCHKPCPPGCAEYGGKCPRLCAPNCTRQAKACPKLKGGLWFTRPKGQTQANRADPGPAYPVAAQALRGLGRRAQDGRLPLEETSADKRQQVAHLIAQVARWDGFGASVATKVLHKKRPRLIPILDNQAIFGAYMNRQWPKRRSATDSVYAESRIREALEWIWTDLSRSENTGAWAALSKIGSARSRIELFDMVWWEHFRRREPVRPASPV